MAVITTIYAWVEEGGLEFSWKLRSSGSQAEAGNGERSVVWLPVSYHFLLSTSRMYLNLARKKGCDPGQVMPAYLTWSPSFVVLSFS